MPSGASKIAVDLKKDEKAELIALTQKGRSGARKIKRANILLLANTRKPDFEIAELLHNSWVHAVLAARVETRFSNGSQEVCIMAGVSKLNTGVDTPVRHGVHEEAHRE